MPEKLNEYLQTVSEQIRWNRARAPLTTELRTHLLEQYDDYLTQGVTEPEAQTETLRQMGDPVTVGQELDQVHQPQPQWGLLILTGLLVLIGSILRFWLTSQSGLPDLSGSDPIRQIAALLLGFACLFGIYILDYSRLGKYARWIYFGTTLLSFVVLAYSPRINHASYYTRYVTLCFPIAYALFVYSLRGKDWKGLTLAILGGIPLVVIATFIPYVLGLFTFLLSGFLILLSAVMRGMFRVHRKIAAGAISIIALAATGWFCWIFRWTIHRRLLYVFHPEIDPLGNGYQAIVLRDALSGSQLWGQGSLSGVYGRHDYWQVVPSGDTDCLLTTFIYQLGWVPFLLLCGALLAILVWAMIKSLRQKNVLGRMLAMSILLTLGIQFLFSLLLNLGFVLTGATCPFLAGNLHTILDMALMGILLSIFRQEQLPFSPQVLSTPKSVHFSKIRLPRYTISVSIKRYE